MVQVRRGGKKVSLGNFATAEEAALHVARSPEGRKAAERVASPATPRRSEEEGEGEVKGEGEGEGEREGS